LRRGARSPRDYPDAWNNRGNALFDLDRLDEALVSYERALALRPMLAAAHLGRGNVLHKMMRSKEALDSYGKALALVPGYKEAHFGRAHVPATVDALRRGGRGLRSRPRHRSWFRGRLVRKRVDWHRLADLVLDTLPYNGHGTTTHALWAGMPVLTCLGPTFAGRVAASVLRAVGLPELVTDSLSDYEARALNIAEDPALCS
jgi:tetratricopeptide (TPR) repeat protein